MFDSTGSLIDDEGEKILVEDKWIKVKPVKKHSPVNNFLSYGQNREKHVIVK